MVTEREPVQNETVKQTEPAKQIEAETPATKSSTENNNPPPAETPTQTASENTKTAYDFEFDMEAIKADCIGVGQSMGLRLDTSLTPSNASWWNPVTASRSNQGEALKQSLERYIKQVRRFIRLTELVPEVLQMVDEKQIAFRPAVEISYLAEEQQYTLLEAMSYNDATPSLAQAIKMKKFNQDGKLTDEVIQSIMEEEKPNQKEKPAFRDERITNLIPKTIPKGQETDFVVKALEFYNRHLQRNKAHER